MRSPLFQESRAWTIHEGWKAPKAGRSSSVRGFPSSNVGKIWEQLNKNIWFSGDRMVIYLLSMGYTLLVDDYRLIYIQDIFQMITVGKPTD